MQTLQTHTSRVTCLTLGCGQDAVMVRVHLIEMAQEGLFELLLVHCVHSRELCSEESEGVTAEAVSGINAGLRADQHEAGTDLLGFVAGHDAVAIEIEASEELVRTYKRFLPCHFGFGRSA